jgi:6-hydroxycyclohex-1-ene-1-carbonyl-CoA dehydrogenase
VRVVGTGLGVEPQAEVTGEVVDAGEAARNWLGQRVVVPRLLPCGECDRCRRGRPATCPARAARAGFSDYETVPARFLCSVEPPLWPASLPREEQWRLAALADAAAAPYGALSRAGLGPGEVVVILGGGPRGAFAIAIAKAKGAHPILIDARPSRRDRALRLGARAVLENGASPEAERAAIAKMTAELSAPSQGLLLLETTGSASGRERALSLVSEGGTAVLLDGGDDAHPVPPSAWESLARSEAQIIGASAAHPDLYPELCALAARGELPLSELTRKVAPSEVAEALAAGRAGELDELLIVHR